MGLRFSHDHMFNTCFHMFWLTFCAYSSTLSGQYPLRDEKRYLAALSRLKPPPAPGDAPFPALGMARCPAPE